MISIYKNQKEQFTSILLREIMSSNLDKEVVENYLADLEKTISGSSNLWRLYGIYMILKGEVK